MKNQLFIKIILILTCLTLYTGSVCAQDNWDKINVIPSTKAPPGDAIWFPHFLKLKNGKTIETNIYELKYIGRFHDFIILSGRECYECDAPFEIYVHPINVESITTKTAIRHEHPGTHYLEGMLIYKAKAFWGNCINEKASEIIWFETHFNDKDQTKKVFTLKTDSKGNLNEKVYENNLPNINKILINVKKGICEEIKGFEYSSL